MNTRDLEILRAISALHKEGMRNIGRRLIELKLNKNFRNKTINNIAFLGFLEGDEETGWVLTAKGAAALRREGP